jgi:hypothetical protein
MKNTLIATLAHCCLPRIPVFAKRGFTCLSSEVIHIPRYIEQELKPKYSRIFIEAGRLVNIGMYEIVSASSLLFMQLPYFTPLLQDRYLALRLLSLLFGLYISIINPVVFGISLE